MARNKARPGKAPGELEQQVLMALAACRSEATGGLVYDSLVARTARELSLPAVYITLDRMREKGWVVTRSEGAEPGRGGKPRKFYSLSDAGADVLRDLRRQFDRLWMAAKRHPLLAQPPGQGK